MASVRLTFLGSGDAFAGGGRFQACLLLEGGAEPLLLDCGATTLVALKRARIDPASIGWVALSHLHGDHFGGLPWLIMDGQFGGRSKPLTIAGPAGLRERLDRTFEALYPGSAEADRPFETTVVEFADRQPCSLGAAVATPVPVRHGSGAPAYALRVEYAGKRIGYSGDSEWIDTLTEAARDTDLFVCECNFFDKDVPGHLSYREIVANRERLDCPRIVLTHMSEEMLAHSDDIEFETASDGASFDV